MAIRQLSIYLANQAGELLKATKVLSDAGINLRALSLADTENFGIMRIITSDTDKAVQALDKAGMISKTREVVAFAMPDKTGGLTQILEVIAKAKINLEYMYVLVTGRSGKAYTVIRVDDNEKTEKVLVDNGIEILKEEDI